ncbi:MAG: hypothetical protein JNM78_09710 [Cyclobacteriaceae bacterium]|nr:hypothetical protein [Cyclobacteriaceae bacterium]
MKMKTIYKIFTFVGLLAVVSACFDDPGTDILLNNAAVIEINEATTAGGLDVSKSYNRVTDGKRIKDSIRVNLVGPQKSQAITVNFTVEPTSTAVAGTHYALITTNTVSIAANSSFGFIYFEVIDDNILPGEIWKLKIKLTSSDGSTTISSKYGEFTRSIRTLCSFNRANFVGTYSTLEPGYGTYDNVSIADPANANGIIINNFWDFGGVVKYTFNPSSTAVTLPTQDVVMGDGVTYVVAGSSPATYNSCTYSFVVPYTVRRKSDNALFDTNTHTFTKK